MKFKGKLTSPMGTLTNPYQTTFSYWFRLIAFHFDSVDTRGDLSGFWLSLIWSDQIRSSTQVVPWLIGGHSAPQKEKEGTWGGEKHSGFAGGRSSVDPLPIRIMGRVNLGRIQTRCFDGFLYCITHRLRGSVRDYWWTGLWRTFKTQVLPSSADW